MEITRPDKLILKGLKSLSGLSYGLYANLKTESKAKAELTFIGEKKLDKVQNQVYIFSPERFEVTHQVPDFEFLKNPVNDQVTWLNFHGIHDVPLMTKLGEGLVLDRLVIRQILDTTQRPKVEAFDDYLFISVKSVMNTTAGELKIEQLSYILGRHYVISFQEEVGDHFEDIRNKISEGLGFIRKRQADYLLSQLLDAILDNYFETIERINFEISLIEKEILSSPDKGTLIAIEHTKRSTLLIKKSLSPFKEALMHLLSGDTSLIRKETKKHFKDLLNSTTAALEETEATLKTLEGLTNIYFASLSHKMNETMKVLTTVATIFIPLTFIAGIYGMNFDNMPELHYENGYFISLFAMLVIALGMVVYFKVKKWV